MNIREEEEEEAEWEQWAVVIIVLVVLAVVVVIMVAWAWEIWMQLTQQQWRVRAAPLRVEQPGRALATAEPRPLAGARLVGRESDRVSDCEGKRSAGRLRGV